jgi:hypothetical protein
MYLHCHNCHWSQDDFWSWDWSGFKIFWKWSRRPFGYNPLSLILEDIAEYWIPRKITFDRWWADENGFKSHVIHSWRLMLWSMSKHFKRLFTQKWWTYKRWKKQYDSKKAVCPNCGSGKHWDVD